ncbi:MAG: universal stress protein [Candidatus Rokuibacteriota bacterium]
MAKRPFPVMVATDGSREAREAVAATAAFPWPDGTRAYGVVASRLPWMAGWRRSVRTAFTRSLLREARRTQGALRRRWADAQVAVVHASPVEAILAKARKRRVRGIVLGSRRVGGLRRLVLGSVSRAVVRRAPCAVLIVKGRLREVRRVLVGLDGSARSRRAVGFVSRLQPPPGGLATLLAVVEPVASTSIGRLPASIRAVVGREFAALQTRHRRAARREVEAAARRLERSGWTVKAEVRRGIPLRELLRAAAANRADVVVVGARGVGGVERLLLGSVAEGTLATAPVSVLIVK